jgi:NCS1 nucleoside transporter family
MSTTVEPKKIRQDGGIEAQGIERILPNARSHVRIFDNFTMWTAANTVLSTIVLGALAIPVFELGLWDSLGVILAFNGLGVLSVAFFSTLGPKLGLRQMTITRFSFGWIGASIMAIFNVVTCIGWSVVNVIVGGQLVNALSSGVVPNWVGILAIAALTTLVSLYGYRYVHRYERYAWMPMALIFLLLFVMNVPQATVVMAKGTGIGYLASLLAFGGAIYGFAAGWGPYAADYNVKQPESTPSARVFWLTYSGVAIPCVLLESLGVMLTTVPALDGKTGGGLVAAALSPLGGLGTLLMLFLVVSVVANNIPNDYSLALSIQVLGGVFQRIKRWVWTIAGSVAYVLIAMSASENFNQTLEHFLLVVAYWLGPWAIILAIEHFAFRRGRYNVIDWNNPNQLPIGWAAMAAMTFGLVGTYLGAAQVAFVGPIAGLFNPPYGMDIGFELGILFAAISYLILRPIELRSTQR